MIQDTLEMAFSENYPMFIIFTIIIASIRITYLIVHKQKFIFYRELFMLAFLTYSLILFYVVTFQDINYGTNNFVPFHEIFRYEFGSKVFINNILGNILLFIPFGYFVSRLMKTRKPWPTLIIAIITAVTIECTQLMIGRTFDVDDIILNVVGCTFGYLIYLLIDIIESHLPPFCSTNMFKNIVVVVFVALLALLYYYSSLWGILR